VAFCADDERNLLKDIEKVTRQRIPSFDRRNDKHLGAITAAQPDVGGKAERPDTRGSQPHRGQHAPKRNRNHGGGREGGRGEGAPVRAAGDKPAFKGPSRGGNRGRGGPGGGAGGGRGDRSGGGAKPASTGVWSNR